MIIKKIDDVPMQDVKMDGAKDVKVRVVFGPADNAPTFAMRVFELAPGGHTPFHTHPFEHEAVILDGDIAAVTEHGDTPLDKGDVLLITPDEKHQFKNRSNSKPARFMCLVPIEYQK
ncbi:MAG: cupin domain-containing protein [Phycisphaerae bacterium]|nr:cupin domain-containing protein [Phycisphaerae bacterium]